MTTRKKPLTFSAFLRKRRKRPQYPEVDTWQALRLAVNKDGDEAIVEARALWREYMDALEQR